jgi:hypothetical protein
MFRLLEMTKAASTARKILPMGKSPTAGNRKLIIGEVAE